MIGDPFPVKAKEIIEYLKNNPVGENTRFTYSKPKSYSFKFKRTPDQTVSELFGHGLDAKLANILYVGQIPEKDIMHLEKNVSALKRVKNTILKEERVFFKNELFAIKKIR